MRDAHFEITVVQVFVRRAVDGTFCVELERVKEIVTLDAKRAVQLQQGVANPTGAVVDELGKK